MSHTYDFAAVAISGVQVLSAISIANDLVKLIGNSSVRIAIDLVFRVYCELTFCAEDTDKFNQLFNPVDVLTRSDFYCTGLYELLLKQITFLVLRRLQWRRDRRMTVPDLRLESSLDVYSAHSSR